MCVCVFADDGFNGELRVTSVDSIWGAHEFCLDL